MKLTPKTFVKFPSSEKAKREFYKTNLIATADLLEALPDSRHDQKNFGVAPNAHSCGTTGCAVGLAAMYNIIPGLQYRVGEQAYYSSVFYIEPVVNGKEAEWDDACPLFFGERSFAIFYHTEANKKQTIAALRRLANEY